MLSALIVEDDAAVAQMLSALVELDGRYRVIAVADDLAGAMRASEDQHVDLALVDIGLARESSGYGVACELNRRDICCIFVTGGAPPFAMPEFALGCIEKPCTIEAVEAALEAAAARLTGSEPSSGTNAGFLLY